MGSFRLFEFIRKTSFLKFFLTWVISIFIFAGIYFVASIFTPGLTVASETVNATLLGVFRSIYASFLAATILGITLLSYDILFKIFVYAQLFFSIIILLILADKIVQKYVLPHYHLSSHHDKKINTIMLMLSIFRTDVGKIEHQYKSKSRKDIETKEIEATIDGLYTGFLEVENLLSVKNVHKHKITKVQYIMLITNIEHSLEKLSSFIDFLDAHNIRWKDKSTKFWIEYILETADKIAMNIDTDNIKDPKTIIAIENIKDYTKAIESKL